MTSDYYPEHIPNDLPPGSAPVPGAVAGVSPGTSLDTVLGSFALEPLHDRATLERYQRNFPDYADDLSTLRGELL